MENARIANLLELAERLENDSSLDWETVFALLEDFPGWLAMAERLCYDLSRSYGMTPILGLSAPDSAQDGSVVGYKRATLLSLFRPYGLLLNRERTPSERAADLKAAEVDVAAFCQEAQKQDLPEIVGAAQEVLTAFRNQRDLLRGTAPEQASELLRSASPSSPATDSLLHPADTSSPTDPPTNWRQRLFSWRRPKS